MLILLFLFLFVFLSCTAILCRLDIICNRGCDEQRRVGTYDNTHQQCEYESADGLATEDKDSQQYNEGRHRG